MSGGGRKWKIRTNHPGDVFTGDSSKNKEALSHEGRASVMLALSVQTGDPGAGPCSLSTFVGPLGGHLPLLSLTLSSCKVELIYISQSQSVSNEIRLMVCSESCKMID